MVNAARATGICGFGEFVEKLQQTAEYGDSFLLCSRPIQYGLFARNITWLKLCHYLFIIENMTRYSTNVLRIWNDD